jgi:large subunit ribosomal protein L30
MEKTIKVSWKRSASGRFKNQRETIKGLGFKRLNQTLVLPDRPEIRGMVHRVVHLVDVVESSKGEQE